MTDRVRDIRILYRRPPNREQVFDQRLVLDRPDVKVTLAESMALPSPKRIDGVTVLESGSSVVWFTFPGLWHDIGRFHDASDTFTGLYANILTPPIMEGALWITTDLYLDIWMPRGGGAVLLDEDELDQALRQKLLAPRTGRRAREEAASILERSRAGRWPPNIVDEWTLERARSVATPADTPRKADPC